MPNLIMYQWFHYEWEFLAEILTNMPQQFITGAHIIAGEPFYPILPMGVVTIILPIYYSIYDIFCI